MRALVRLIVDLLRQDTRTAVRTLWKHRGFTAFATVSLALGIGANTALFSLVDRLLLRSLPVSEPDRLVEVQQTISRLGIQKAITGETLQVFAAGLAAGLVLAAIAVRATATVVGDLLFGVTATDTATVAGAALVMLLVASAACLLPARRAVSIDPLAAIRDQS